MRSSLQTPPRTFDNGLSCVGVDFNLIGRWREHMIKHKGFVLEWEGQSKEGGGAD